MISANTQRALTTTYAAFHTYLVQEIQKYVSNLAGNSKRTHPKVASINMSQLEACFMFYRLVMKR